jgi:Fur family ferric uptake transcriptional regulator
MTHFLLNYPERMRASGYRVTPQRKAILDAICESGRSLPIEDILLRLQRKAPRLNRATVYRNLIFLQRMNLVNATGSGKARLFEIAGLEPHYHLRCRVCGKEAECSPRRIRTLMRAVRKDCGFEMELPHGTFSGVCRVCLSGNKEGSANRRSLRRKSSPRRKHG